MLAPPIDRIAAASAGGSVARADLRHEAESSAHVILGGVDVEKFRPGEGLARDGNALFVGRILPEIVRAGVTGFVVPPGDRDALGERLRWLRANPAEAARMGAAGRRLVLDQFTWPRVVQRCLEIYRQAA